MLKQCIMCLFLSNVANVRALVRACAACAQAHTEIRQRVPGTRPESGLLLRKWLIDEKNAENQLLKLYFPTPDTRPVRTLTRAL